MGAMGLGPTRFIKVRDFDIRMYLFFLQHKEHVFILLPAAHPPPCLPASPWTSRGLLWAPFGALGTLSESSLDPLWAPLGALGRPSASQGSSLNAQCDETLYL